MATTQTEPRRDRVGDLSPTIAPIASEPPDFSLVLGGPLYQALAAEPIWPETALELLHRRVIVLAALAWVPLLLLSIAEGHAWGGVALPFLYDVELHVRLLLAMPLLIVAELVVHRRLRQWCGSSWSAT